MSKPITPEVQNRIDEARNRKAACLVAFVDSLAPRLLGLDPMRDAERIAAALLAWTPKQWAVAAQHAKCNPPGLESIRLVLAAYEARARGPHIAAPVLREAIEAVSRLREDWRAAQAKRAGEIDAELEIDRLGEALKGIAR